MTPVSQSGTFTPKSVILGFFIQCHIFDGCEVQVTNDCSIFVLDSFARIDLVDDLACFDLRLSKDQTRDQQQSGDK